MRKVPNVNKHLFKQPGLPWQDAAAEPAFSYDDIAPRHLYVLGDYDAGAGADGEWPSTGSEAETLAGLASNGPTAGASGQAVFNGTSQGLSMTMAQSYPDTGWTSWIKFKTGSTVTGGRFTLYEWNANRIAYVNYTKMTVKSSTGGDSTNALAINTEYNMWITHDNAATITCRIEKNDSTLQEEFTLTYNNLEPAAGPGTMGHNASADWFNGEIFEFGAVGGVVSEANLTSLMTHLKGL